MIAKASFRDSSGSLYSSFFVNANGFGIEFIFHKLQIHGISNISFASIPASKFNQIAYNKIWPYGIEYFLWLDRRVKWNFSVILDPVFLVNTLSI